ncbi:MAG TPA: site-specific integrase [Solirubrobacteraceae bacterium]|nr:site-specific integrase [Solirubrobacteraceae bacterium]
MVPKVVPKNAWYPSGTQRLLGWSCSVERPHLNAFRRERDAGGRQVPVSSPTASIIVREYRGRPYYEAKFRHQGQQIKRRIGPAWLERDPEGGWRRHRGRVPESAFDERAAHVAAAQIVAEYVAEASDRERAEYERRTRGATFREVAHAYLRWLEDVRGAKPSTLVGHRSVLGEPGTPYRRGKGTTLGHVMAALGDRPAAKITTREVEDVLATISETGASPRTVNKHRNVIAAVFGYGCKPSTYGLPANPAKGADKRREPSPGALVFYSPEEIEALARALADGRHRDPSRPAVSAQERDVRQAEDRQDAEMIRVAAYAGLRQGELLALRWRDVDFAGSALTIARAMSAGVESSTKSGHTRRVPLADQAAAALERISRREHFTSPDDFVFCRPLDDSALRRRYRRAQDAAGIRPLRFHDLRHTFGSLLAMRGVDVVTIQKAMGHSTLATTSRYLHARPASEQAQAFTAAFAAEAPGVVAVAAA